MLNYEEELWIKLYVRDTSDFMALSWQARGLFCLALRKVDRKGYIDLGTQGIKALAGHLIAPWKEIEPHVAELLDNGCLTVTDTGKLFVPNFEVAQKSRLSQAARKRAERERKKAEKDHGAEPPPDQGGGPAGPEPSMSQKVTEPSKSIPPPAPMHTQPATSESKEQAGHLSKIVTNGDQAESQNVTKCRNSVTRGHDEKRRDENRGEETRGSDQDLPSGDLDGTGLRPGAQEPPPAKPVQQNLFGTPSDEGPAKKRTPKKAKPQSSEPKAEPRPKPEDTLLQPKPQEDPRVHRIKECYEAAYRKARNRLAPTWRKVDAGFAIALIKSLHGDVDRVCSVITRAFADPFFSQKVTLGLIAKDPGRWDSDQEPDNVIPLHRRPRVQRDPTWRPEDDPECDKPFDGGPTAERPF